MEIKVYKLSKSYGARLALKDVTLELAPGIIAIMGPNGSGKTTLLRSLASLIYPDSGQLWFDGFPYLKNLQRLRSQVGYLPQELDFPGHLTPRQLLTYLATLKKVRDKSQIEWLIRALELVRVADFPLTALSEGQVRLVGIAQAFLGCPSLLLLDEPTRGLDVEERARVFSLMRRPAPGRLTIYSTHELEDIEQMADRVIILSEGQVLYFR